MNPTDALTVLRTETALSRFPMHKLTKGTVKIELRNEASAIQWKLTHNSEYGQPGHSAYKLETLFINRRIEEQGRPVPKTIRLGSLREIAEAVGLGTNTNAVKKALLQNATATIAAKISYRTQDGGEQWLEAVFNRYSVVFTGETLPTGGSADAVYLVLNDIYQQILNTAVFRPLDYEYMKSLSPISQRFYEIISYQIFAALKHGNPRAKLPYSEYCALSTATRYGDFDHVKKQMYKALRPHIQSGYLAKVEYQAITDEKGEPDWMMYLTPGINADREYRAFTGQSKLQKPRKSKAKDDNLSLSLFGGDPESVSTEAGAETANPSARTQRKAVKPTQGEANPQVASTNGRPALDAETLELVEALVAAQLNRSDAERFALACSEVCRRQLEYLPYVKSFKSSQGAYLRRAIEGDFAPPNAYNQALQRQVEHETLQAERTQSQSVAANKQARQDHEARFHGDYLAFLKEREGEVEKTQPEAFTAFSAWVAEQRAVYQKPPFAGRPMTEKALEVFDREESRLERFCTYFRERGISIPTFWEWDERVNPQGYGSRKS